MVQFDTIKFCRTSLITSGVWKNKTGTSQKGAISKAQKYSRNNFGNIWEIFFKKSFFSKKSGTMRKNSKIGLLVSIKVFTNRKLQKNARGYPLIEFKSFRKKSHSAEKSQRGAFGLASTFGSINKFVVKCENRTHDLLLLRKLVEQMNKRL